MFTQETSSTDPTAETSVKTLVVTDLVDSTAKIESLGDQRAAAIFERHNIAARELLSEFNGLEIDRTDGFLLCFDRPIDAVRYALAYHDSLAELSGEVHLSLTARVGIHLGEILLRKNKPEFVARGAKALEAEGLAKPVAARIMSLAMSGQTLMTQAAFDLARRAAVGQEEIPRDIHWIYHGKYLFKGVDAPQAVCEVGRRGFAPLSAPPDSEKVKRAIAPGEEETLGWRPAVDLEIPGRSGWTLQRKLGDGGFGEVWLVRHNTAHSHKAFKFCFQADRLRGLKRELTLFRLMKETLGERSDIARLYEVHLDAPPFYLEMEYTEGGDLAETGVRRSEGEQIDFAQKELSSLFPWMTPSKAQWATHRIDRAEPAQAERNRPDHPYHKSTQNLLVCWPTKLTLVPMMAESICATLTREHTLPAQQGGKNYLALPDLPIAEVSPAPWETAF